MDAGKRRRKRLGPSALTGYVSAISNFLRFLSVKSYLLKGFATESELPGYITTLANISKALFKKRMVEDKARKMLQIESIIPPAILGMFKNSTVYKSAKHLLSEIKHNRKPVSKKSFEQIRNAIILQVYVSNGKRAGDITNMKVAEFEKWRTGDEEGDHIVFVSEHKTSASKFSNVNFHGKLFKLVEKYRISFSEFLSQSDELFPYVSSSSVVRKMKASELNVCLNRVWGEYVSADQRPELVQFRQGTNCTKINTSNIRFSIVTAYHELHPDLGDQTKLSIHFAHDAETARRHYDARMGASTSSHATKQIRRMTGEGETSDSAPDETPEDGMTVYIFIFP